MHTLLLCIRQPQGAGNSSPVSGSGQNIIGNHTDQEGVQPSSFCTGTKAGERKIMSARGIDVSAYQGKPDWKQVKQSGMEFAILRILNSKGKDTSFEHNYAGCKAAGIRRGVYRYSYALTEAQAQKEAREVIEALAGRKLELGVWLDLEWSRQRALGSAKVKKIAGAWMKVIRDAGYACNIYCNTDWYKNVCGGLNAKYWIARYPAEDDGTIKESLRPNMGEVGWQYSSKGKVSGISGNVDMDICYDTVVPAPEPEEPMETVLWDMEAVRSLQEALNADGIRDENGNRLQVDGIKGNRTSAAVEKILLKAGAFDASRGRYTVGSTGQVVQWLQMRLNTVIGDQIVKLLGKGVVPDGKLGADTHLAIGLFQEKLEWTPDYIAGVKTVTELLKA